MISMPISSFERKRETRSLKNIWHSINKEIEENSPIISRRNWNLKLVTRWPG
jgi:hypothetical protein